MKPTLLASLCAVAVQPLLFAVLFLLPPAVLGEPASLGQSLQLLALVLVFAITFAIVGGVPIFYLLRHLKRESWLSLSVAGFLLAAFPMAVIGWPVRGGYSAGNTWHGKYVETVVDGVPTIYGWLQYAEAILFYGLHGLVGAAVFYLVWLKIRSPNQPLNAIAPKNGAPH